jgi:hypothetical protein
LPDSTELGLPTFTQSPVDIAGFAATGQERNTCPKHETRPRRAGKFATMSISESTGAQDWRAIACLAPSGERLLCYGGTSAQVRAAYTGAWGEVIRDEDRPTVKAISLQRWAGLAWAGQWEHQTYLAVPATRGGKAGPGESTGEPVAASS